MALYDMICDAIRDEELRRRPLADQTSCAVHFRAKGASGQPEIVIGRYWIDPPAQLAERVYQVDEALD